MARLSTRLLASTTALFGLAVICTPLWAQQHTVYQWKDAKGVTHYADAPPAQTYKKRDINVRSGTAMEVVEAGQPAVNASCSTARINLERLRGQATVGLDADGDGKPDALMNAEQRAKQVALNEALLKASCPAPTVAGNG